MRNTADIRKANLLAIIKVLIKNPFITRPEIAQKTKLTNMTVTTLMAELEKKNIVAPAGKQDSRGGRKAQLYNINCNDNFIVGLNLQIDRATVALFNLCGKLATEPSEIEFSSKEQVESSVAKMAQTITDTINNGEKKREQILAIGITLPGRINYKKGIVHHLTNMPHWRDVPLKDMLEDELNLPVFLERDTNAHISSLKMSGLVDDVPNMFYLVADEGVGAGIIIDNAVYHGANSNSCEVGHTSIDINGPLCNCGNNGCVEKFISNSAIVEAYANKLKSQSLDASEPLSVLGKRKLENEYVLKMVKYAQDGDKIADSVFRQVVVYLTSSLVSTMNVFDPSIIIVESKWLHEDKRYFHALVDEAYSRSKLLGRSDVKIVLNPLRNIFEVSPYTVVQNRILFDIENNLLLDSKTESEE